MLESGLNYPSPSAKEPHSPLNEEGSRETASFFF